MNAVSTREATGSAAKASAAGKAIRAISRPSSSNLKTCLFTKKEKKNTIEKKGPYQHIKITIQEPES